ncbi:MAG TPA: insulinase family protein, partial [Thermoanaerobaculia bacterium]|nr:insulinase family protein [Thermoanaerobaculia bacterium]
ILLSAPETQKAKLPAEKELLGTFQQVTARQINPWVDRVRQGPLVAEAPKPGRIVSESRVEELNVTEWRLSNGVRVIMKPTDFQNDEILLTSYSPGGSSLVPDSKYLSAAFATAVIRDAGLGRFDRITLEKALAGKAAGVLPYIGTFEEGIRGVAAARDLETMFQLVYLNVTAPRKDPKLFLSLLGGLEEQLRTRVSSPEAVFADELRKAMAQGNPRQEPLSLERLQEIDFETAYQVYRDRFADVGDFTFVLVGNFTPESIKPLVLTWLGSLPTKGRRESWRDPGDSTTFDSVVKVDVAKGLEPKSQVRMLFSGPATFSRENRHVMESLARVLQIRLREVLREDMGAVYGVQAEGGLSSRPRGEYTFHIAFGCAPEKVDSLVQAVFAEIESIQKNGVPDGYLQKVREQERREREVAERENRFWLGALEAYASEGWDLRGILRYGELVEMVTSERLQQAAQAYFHRDRYLLGVLRPEAPVPAQTAPAAVSTTTGR